MIGITCSGYVMILGQVCFSSATHAWWWHRKWTGYVCFCGPQKPVTFFISNSYVNTFFCAQSTFYCFFVMLLLGILLAAVFLKGRHWPSLIIFNCKIFRASSKKNACLWARIVTQPFSCEFTSCYHPALVHMFFFTSKRTGIIFQTCDMDRLL